MMIRAMHVELDDERNKKLKEIVAHLWETQRRSSRKVDAEGLRFAIDYTHEAVCGKSTAQ